jgi:hypothetical protein
MKGCHGVRAGIRPLCRVDGAGRTTRSDPTRSLSMKINSERSGPLPHFVSGLHSPPPFPALEPSDATSLRVASRPWRA